jgi:hypothetical protein
LAKSEITVASTPLYHPLPPFTLASPPKKEKCYNTGMRRLLILIVLVLCGCGKKSAPTLHEKYVAAAAEYDRENLKLTHLTLAAKNSEFNARAICEFFRLSESLDILYLPKFSARGRGRSEGYHLEYGRYYELLPEVIAVREQAKVVKPLRERATQALNAWRSCEYLIPPPK